MIRLRLVVEYVGTNFSGWQVQPGERTVQGELHKVLETVLRQEIHAVNSSGRTDAGVHAKRQVVHFDVNEAPSDMNVFRRSVSSILRNEVSVVRADIVDQDFHSLRSAIKKQYTYRILNRDVPPTFDKGFVWHIPVSLDVQLMQQSAQSLLGEHSFASFQGADCKSRSTIKTIYESDISIADQYLTYRVVGSGFLKHMVRIIVGTLVDIGKHKSGMGVMTEILKSQNRETAGITAPARGLSLDWVEYPEGRL